MKPVTINDLMLAVTHDGVLTLCEPVRIELGKGHILNVTVEGETPTPMSFHVQELRPEVLAFALLMEQRLREKDAEWGGNSWKDADIGNLQVCATAKIFSIETAILKGPEKDAIKHSVDLANYAMMIADVAGGLDEAVEIINGEPQH